MTINSTQNRPILVTGAAGDLGAIGRNLTTMLLDKGHPVRALVRREDERAEALRQLGAEVVQGDLTDLDSMHRAIATGGFGPGSDIARAQLEWLPPPAGFAAIGFKGGSYPGVLADAFYMRRSDGTVATAVLLERRVPEATWVAALEGLNEQELLIGAMAEPPTLRRLACAL